MERDVLLNRLAACRGQAAYYANLIITELRDNPNADSMLGGVDELIKLIRIELLEIRDIHKRVKDT